MPTAIAIRTMMTIVQNVIGLFTLASLLSAALLFLRLVLTNFLKDLIIIVQTTIDILL